MFKKINFLIFIIIILFSCKSKYQGLSEEILKKELLKAIETNKIKDVRNIIKHGVKINFGDKINNNPLAKALFRKRWKIADLLVENGADLNYKIETTCVAPIMFIALGISRYDDIVKYLILKGANVNEKTSKGANALLYAACQNKVDIAKLLIEKNADINIKTPDNNRTPLTMATLNGNKEIVALLIDNGVNINQVGFQNRTALEIARRKKNKDIIAMLEKASIK